MPFKITGACSVNAGRVTYTETDAAKAKTDLASLRKQLQHADGTTKSGVLKLVPLKDGTGYQLRRTQWYHFGSRSDAKMKEAAAFVEALIKAAYPGDNEARVPSEDETTEESTRKDFIPIMEKRLIKNLSAYLNPSHQRVGTRGLMKLLATSGLETQKIKVPSQEQIKGLQDMGMEFHKSADFATYEKREVKAFLKGCGVRITDEPFGRGGFGEVYSVALEGDVGGSNYVFKFELETDEKKRPEFFLNQLTERGDLAATKVDTLRHMTQPIFVVLKVTTNKGMPNEKSEYHYVPAGKADQFKEDLVKPNAKVAYSTVGQLMARAPGTALSTVLQESPDLLKPSTRRFKNVATTLCNFFKSAWKDNYCHFDIKPENINLDAERDNGECTLLDGGLAKQGKKDFKATNRGTAAYIHPFLYKQGHGAADGPAQGTKHRSEVDACSIAMTLLKLAAPEDFQDFSKTVTDNITHDENNKSVFPDTHPLFGNEEPSTYLDTYLKFLNPLDPLESETAKALEADPKLKALLQHCFEISGFHDAAEPKREDAFKAWETAFEDYASADES